MKKEFYQLAVYIWYKLLNFCLIKGAPTVYESHTVNAPSIYSANLLFFCLNQTYYA